MSIQIDPKLHSKEIINQYLLPIKQDTHFYVPLFTKRLKALGLTITQIEGINKAIKETCNHCWDANNLCQCWNND